MDDVVMCEGTVIVHNKKTGEIRIYVDSRFWSELSQYVGRRFHIFLLPKDFSSTVIIILPNGEKKIIKT